MGSEPREIGKAVAAAGIQSGLDQIDLTRYDFDGFRSDIEDILDLPGAIASMLKWIFGIPIVVAILTTLLFTLKLGGFGLFAVVALLTMLAVPVAILGAVATIARRRVNQSTQAAGRAVDLVGLLHEDVESVRETGAEVPMRAMGEVIAENVVLPAMRVTVTRWAAFTGPTGFIARPLIASVLKVVEAKTMASLRQLPNHGLGPAALPAGPQDAITPEIVEAPRAVQAEYSELRTKIENRVARVGGIVATPMMLIAVAAAFGWLMVFAMFLILV